MAGIAGILAGLAIFLFCWPFLQNRSRAVKARRPVHHSWDRRRTWFQALQPYLGIESADSLCQHAGRPGGLTGAALLQYQWLFALLCVVLLGAASVALGLVAGLLAWYMPRIVLSALAGQRRAQIALELPAFLDLWGLLVASGEGVETALVEICKRHPDWLLSAEVRRAVDRMLASGLFGESLVEEAKVTGSQEFLIVAEQVRHLAEGGGVPSRELAKMAEQMREQRVAELVQSAGTMAIVGIFPKLFAIFLSLMPVIGTIILTVMKEL
ncbi:MAG TPA: type II secretion system F family protein [Symbiobacteriaceae bacterium]|nr:type II secretion system F family protein [Symbiobacteriaceae bacterium]